MSFTDQQKSALSAPLDRTAVKQRKQGNAQVSYIEGWHAENEANRIFGFDGWDRETVEIKCVSERERTIGKPPYEKPGWGVSYTARVRITVRAGEAIVVREGVGAGHGIDVDPGQAHESAIKEAETDAEKRALKTFGNPFGQALYDKEQTQVAEPKSEMLEQLRETMLKSQTPRDLSTWEENNLPFIKKLTIAEQDRLKGEYQQFARGLNQVALASAA